MAKQRVQNYVFLPGVSSSSNAYPNAYALIQGNKTFITKESSAFIASKVVLDTAQNLYPNAVSLLTNNKQFILDEISAWTTAQVAAATVGTTFFNYTYGSTEIAKCKRDMGYLIDALIYDVRYGGNEQVSYVASQYYLSGVIQLINVPVEVAIQTQFWSLITNFILTKATYTSQQSPVTTTQNKTGSAGESNAITWTTTLSTIASNVMSGGLSTLPTKVYSNFSFAGYTYDSGKCERDVAFVLDAYLHDLRYGGNVQTRLIASRYWDGERPQIIGDRKTEIITHQWIRDLINDVLIPDANYVPLQNSYPRQVLGNITGESGSDTRITVLTEIVTTVIQNGLLSVPTQVSGVSSIKLQGKYDLDKILLVTNTTSNQVIYNFADPTLGGTVSFAGTYDSNGHSQDDDYPQFVQTSDYVTMLYLVADTSTASANDDVQIFIEAPEQKVRPYDFGTDAIERMRVAQPQSMLDADFEYGLQPTKWQAIGIARGYPSIYEIPGSDQSVVSVVTDASNGTGGIGESLITVTTQSAHGFAVGTPISIRSLANTISGFNRAEGTFIVISVPTPTSFTYYATAKVGTSVGQVLATTYTQLRKAGFYTGASIGTPTLSVYSNGQVSSFTSKFITNTASQQIAVAGSIPSLGVPITVSGVSTGTQITGTVGTGGLQVSATVKDPSMIGDSSLTVIDPTGILEGMAVDNGTGTALFVSSIASNTINLTGQLTAFRAGTTETYLNVTGTNIANTGSNAEFSIDRISGQYTNLQITTAGSGYAVGNKISIAGSLLGGVNTVNDAIIEVTSIDGSNGIQGAAIISGISISGERSYTNLSQDITTGLGTTATFDISTNNGVYDVTIVSLGIDYALNETLTILGSVLGGSDSVNDLTITVTSVSAFGGSITGFSVAGTPATIDTTYSLLTGTNVNTGDGASFDITRSSGSYSIVPNLTGSAYSLNDKILIDGADIGGISLTNDATVTITNIDPLTGGVLSASIAGLAVGGTTIGFWSAVSLSEITTAPIADNTSIATVAIATIQITWPTNHGLVPGMSILVDITSTGTNHAYAKGPFFVEQVPSLNTIRYTARTSGSLDTGTALVGTVYARPQSFFIHRPFDGGVQLGTGGPQHGSQAIRMSKKYIRYQSGKGVMYTTGALFAPSYNLQSATALGTTIGSYITFTTDDTDHGCQVGGKIRISGIDTPGYNGEYTIVSIQSERVFTVQAQTTLGGLYGSITSNAQMSILNWHGATVRAGTFDDQNGMFWQYDGQQLYVGRRSSTLQLAGVSTIAKDTNLITGQNTRFRDQVKAGDKLVIKGMTHVITSVVSQTTMYVTPDYRGANSAVNSKICLVQEILIPQREFNLDRLDGTGPSGYNLDITKMQMIGMQWSWYGAGFIDFMLRGSDGNYVFCHRIRNSNVNTEAYMRTGNMPVRYEVQNEVQSGKLLNSITASQTTIPLTDASSFPNEAGYVYIDNEIIAFSGKTGNTLTGCSRAAPLPQFSGGSTRLFRGGSASTHEVNTGVILISNTITPIISHWGSAFLTDGRFDEDRGYIFNYASTGIQASTTKQTAFLIRLAPSVSNAQVGDLGDKELINRAQLLLQQIEVTSDTGTGGLVVEGILNPQNYPVDPTAITWSSLNTSAAGGQPSFAQVAPGGSVSWAGGASTTTSTATTTATLSGTASVPNNTLFTTNSGTNLIYVTKTSWDTLGAAIGFAVDSSETRFPNGTTVSTVTENPQPVATTLGNITGTATIPPNNYFKTPAGVNYLYFTQASWNSLNGVVGSSVSSSDFPAGTTVSSITGPAVASGQSYYTVVFSANATLPHNPVQTSLATYYAIVNNNVVQLYFNVVQTNVPYSVGDQINVTGNAGATQINGVFTVASCTTSYVTYNLVTFNINQSSSGNVVNLSPLATTSFTVTGQALSGASSLNFTQASWAALPIGTAVVGNTVNDTGKFGAGTTISSISTLKTFNGTNYYTVGFNSGLIAPQATGQFVTFSYTPYYAVTLSKNATSQILYNTTVPFTPAIIGTNTSFLYFTKASWETLVSSYNAGVGTLVADTAKFPSGTTIQSIGSLLSFGGTQYYRVNFTQSAITSIAGGSAVTFQFGLPPYALPGETVFSFIAAPGAISNLDLSSLKELTNTAIGGRGTYPNGPDVLAINVYKTSGTAISTNVIIRWGEAQA